MHKIVLYGRIIVIKQRMSKNGGLGVLPRFISLLFLGICFSTCLCACSREGSTQEIFIDGIEEIILDIDEDSISAEGLTLTVHNMSKKTIYLDPWYCLEKLTNGQWDAVEPVPGVYWTQDDWRLAIYEDCIESNDYLWEWYYGKLPAGEYRIIIYVWIE